MTEKNFTIYKSSAGSGKTFTLVKEYLALALSEDSDTPKAYRHILAITFTNKAAAEMKERIIKSLKELSTEDYTLLASGTKTMLSELKKHPRLNKNGQPDDAIIRSRANNVLKEILHNYSDFAIGTIDSFVSRIVRAFAFDLEIPMNFELEMDAEKLLAQAIDLLLNQIGTDEQLTKALIDFAESKTDDEKSWHIENDLQHFAKNLLNEEGAVYVDKLKQLRVEDFFKIKETLQNEIKKFEAYVSKQGKVAQELIAKSGVDVALFAGGAKGTVNYFNYLADVRYDKLQPTATVQKNIDTDKWYAAKATASDKSGIDSIKNELLTIYNDTLRFIEQHSQEIIVFRLINTNLYSLAVLNEIEKLLNEYKAQNNILHISEFNKLIAKIVLTEPTPFIYERIGEKYNNYLIDEFQDTSVLQFQNLLPLIDNSLANGHFTMLVGDGKQAIYRWRGGEVEQFALLPQVFAANNNPLVLERENALKRNHNPQILSNNFRSKREIIEFNNAVFRTLSQQLNDKYRSIYDSLEQGFNPENTGGYVQVEFITDEKETFTEKNLERTHAIILELLQQNYQPKDIAVLVRRNKDGSTVANYLSALGMEVISSESLLLSNSTEVNFLFSLIKYINTPDNRIVQAEINQYLKSLAQEYSINPINTYTLSKLALYELTEELIRTFGLHHKPNAYIQFFLDEVLNYSIKQNNNLSDFITYWEEKKDRTSLVVPQGLNAITIMTVHRSKGLEFPAVILPFSNGKIEKGKKNLWIDIENPKIAELPAALVPNNESLSNTAYADAYDEEKHKSRLDALNVLYVALTRPEERLYILTGKASGNPSNFNTYSDMFAYYYQATAQWEENKTVYSYGNQTPHIAHKQQTLASTLKLDTFNSNQWRNTIKMRAAAPSIWNLDIENDKKNYGVMVHTALSRIKTTTDIEPALRSMLAEGLLTLAEQEKLQSLLHTITSIPMLQKHFATGLTIKNEAEIITPSGEKFRVDRVVIHPNNTVTIIDYKTGEPKPGHKKQVLQYADLITQMGYTVTAKLLVYLEEENVVAV